MKTGFTAQKPRAVLQTPARVDLSGIADAKIELERWPPANLEAQIGAQKVQLEKGEIDSLRSRCPCLMATRRRTSGRS